MISGAANRKLEEMKESREKWERFIFGMCERNLLFFLFGKEGSGYAGVKGVDGHDVENPIKVFPRHRYLYVVASTWEKERYVAVAKSRQMTITWLMCACFLWDAMFHKGRSIFFISEKLDKAHDLVERCGKIYRSLPEFMRKRVPSPMGEKYVCSSYAEMIFPSTMSFIKGLGQGATQLNQYTASGILFDEADLQEEFEETYGAAFPTVVGGGRLTIVSSPRKRGAFARIYFANDGETKQVMIQ